MLDTGKIAEILRRSPNSWEIEFVESIDSTNTELSRRFSSAESAPFFLLCADEQTAGRGRLTRKWFSIKGADITASVIFPSPVQRQDTPKLTIPAGLALVEVLEKEYGMDSKVRWPNDVLTEKGKIAGILSAYLPKPDAVICGTGINVNSEPDALSLGPYRTVTTLGAELGRKIERESLLAQWLLAYEKIWELAGAENLERLKTGFDNVSYYLRKRVRILVDAAGGRDEEEIEATDEFEGIARGLDDSGALTVTRDDGSEYSVGIEDLIIPLN